MEDNNHKRRRVIKRSVHISRPPRSRKERVEMDRKVLRHMLDYIQNCGEAKGLTITTDEMAGKLGITGLVLEAYLSGGERIPKHLTIRLRDAYDSLLKPIQLKQNREGLKHGVVLLRNHGLAKGINITLDEMAWSVGITREELMAFLRGESDPPEDMEYHLHTAWKAFLEDAERVEIVEELDAIIMSC